MRRFVFVVAIVSFVAQTSGAQLYGGPVSKRLHPVDEAGSAFRDKIAELWEYEPLKVAAPLLLGAGLAICLQLFLRWLEQRYSGKATLADKDR